MGGNCSSSLETEEFFGNALSSERKDEYNCVIWRGHICVLSLRTALFFAFVFSAVVRRFDQKFDFGVVGVMCRMFDFRTRLRLSMSEGGLSVGRRRNAHQSAGGPMCGPIGEPCVLFTAARGPIFIAADFDYTFVHC